MPLVVNRLPRRAGRLALKRVFGPVSPSDTIKLPMKPQAPVHNNVMSDLHLSVYQRKDTPFYQKSRHEALLISFFFLNLHVTCVLACSLPISLIRCVRDAL